MKIPLVDLKIQYQSIKTEIDTAIQRVLEQTDFILGEELQSLEKEVAQYCGTKYAIGVASGTDALVLSLNALGIGKGDEVITTPFTFIATSEAICRVGAKPIFIDIDEKTYNLDPEKIEQYLKRVSGIKHQASVKAIIPVHLYGLPCEMDSIINIAKRYNLKVVEDCAQALGSEYKGRKVGSLGDIGCLSFFPGKNLGAYGDGGMIVTNDAEVAERIKMLRNHGSKTKYYYLLHGFNSRLDTLQATILRVKLKYLDKWIDQRCQNALYYNQLFSRTEIITPNSPNYVKHSFNYYTIRLGNSRDKIQKTLQEESIATAIYYPLSLHLQEVYGYLDYKKGDFPVSEQVQDEVLSLPMYPELTRDHIKEISENITKILS